MSISIIPNNLLIGKGTTAEFTAMATGISTDDNNFIYQWRKRDSNSLPEKVLGVNESVLTIPDVLESDEGQYYCIVTNEWNRSVESDNVALTIYGTYAIMLVDIALNGYNQCELKVMSVINTETTIKCPMQHPGITRFSDFAASTSVNLWPKSDD